MAVFCPQGEDFFFKLFHFFPFLKEEIICFVKSFPKWGVLVMWSVLDQPVKYKTNPLVFLWGGTPWLSTLLEKERRYLPKTLQVFLFTGTFCPSRCLSQDMSFLNVNNFSSFVKPELSWHDFYYVAGRQKFQDYHIHLACPDLRIPTPMTYLDCTALTK